ncbi:hypothetical protein BKA64DRAFT_236784 [Cadophora sp. MPI-SDFR-AT-0126]|nr:hypothetical protein BKA64DRAFT_236784 [Leotiomycetes sp. MPI-SDFR-AT-0126]
MHPKAPPSFQKFSGGQTFLACSRVKLHWTSRWHCSVEFMMVMVMLALAPSTGNIRFSFSSRGAQHTIGQIVPELLFLVCKLGQGPDGQLTAIALLTILVASNSAVQHAIVMSVRSKKNHVTKDSSGIGRDADAVLERLSVLLAKLGALPRVEIFGPAKKTHVCRSVVSDDEQHALIVLRDSGTLDILDGWSMLEDKLEGLSVLWELDLGLANFVPWGAGNK